MREKKKGRRWRVANEGAARLHLPQDSTGKVSKRMDKTPDRKKAQTAGLSMALPTGSKGLYLLPDGYMAGGRAGHIGRLRNFFFFFLKAIQLYIIIIYYINVILSLSLQTIRPFFFVSTAPFIMARVAEKIS